MKKERRKFGEIAKITAISLALAGMFGLALLGANTLAFANATNRTMEIPPFEAMNVFQTMPAAAANEMGVSVAKALSAEDTPRRNLTVNEITFNTWIWGTPAARGENTLSAEDAAQIGAQYIYEIFGEDIDGATVQMTFNGYMRHSGNFGVWSGIVGDGIVPENLGIDVEMPIGTPLFYFMLNAEMGEAIHVERMAAVKDDIIILTPRSHSRIIMEIPHDPRKFEGVERFEFFFQPLDPSQWEEWGLPWELPLDRGNVLQIDDLEEFLRIFEGSGGSILHRFTPRVEQQNNNGSHEI
jgi:hypothetical protein